MDDANIMEIREIEIFIKDEISPVLSVHGGDLSVLSLEGEILTVRLEGGCVGCPSSKLSFYNIVLPKLTERFPSLTVEITGYD